MKAFKSKFILLVVVLLCAPLTVSAQCAMCRAALKTSGNQAMAEGVNHGITYLMIFPYLIVGIIGFVAYRIMKSTKTPS